MSPRKKAKPSLEEDQHFSVEIDLDYLDQIAKEADAGYEKEPKRKRKEREPESTYIPPPSSSAGNIRVDQGIPQPEPMDPEFPIMFQTIWGVITDFAEKQFDWEDPGITWKEKMGMASAKLAHKYFPLMGEHQALSEFITYLTIWIGSNVAIKQLALSGESGGERSTAAGTRTNTGADTGARGQVRTRPSSQTNGEASNRKGTSANRDDGKREDIQVHSITPSPSSGDLN